MRVSFDLDDTLICHQEGVPREPPLPWYLRPFAANEPPWFGAVSLLHGTQGAAAWRCGSTPRRTATLVGLQVALPRRPRPPSDQPGRPRLALPSRPGGYPPSKNPRLWIDLHVDDSDGVRMEARQHGFQVVVVSPEDPGWDDKVRRAVGL
ncbi:MAG: hypothetical protein U0797_29200 [Gemmataceae bacterium]